MESTSVLRRLQNFGKVVQMLCYSKNEYLKNIFSNVDIFHAQVDNVDEIMLKVRDNFQIMEKMIEICRNHMPKFANFF